MERILSGGKHGSVLNGIWDSINDPWGAVPEKVTTTPYHTRASPYQS